MNAFYQNKFMRRDATWLFLLAFFGCSPIYAGENNPADQLGTVLGKKIDSVHQAEFGDIYEVVSDNKIIYVDKTFRYAISGHIIDLKEKRDITAERLRKINEIKFENLPFGASLKSTHGDGRRTIAVFSDPNCPFCQRLEKTLTSIDNLTIYTFMYPVLSEDSQRLARDVWCSPDKENAWRDWMIGKKRPHELECESPNEIVLTAGKTFHVNATPVIFFGDGSRMAGAVNAEQIRTKLESLDAQAH